MSKQKIDWIKWGSIAALIACLPIVGGYAEHMHSVWDAPEDLTAITARLDRMDNHIVHVDDRLVAIEEIVANDRLTESVRQTNSPYAQKHENENSTLK